MKQVKPKFTWKVVRVAINKIKPTPNNYKLKTESGLARFNHSVGKYGRAGAVILNADYTLINGNTNIEKAKELGEEFVDASMPDKKLSPKEFQEFAAMFDAAVAGEVDMLRIKSELGTSASFFKSWGLEMPNTAMAKLNAMEKNDGAINPTVAHKSTEQTKEAIMRPITLIFTPEQSAEYLKLAESLYKVYKVDNVTDLSLKVLRNAKRLAR